MYRIVVSAVTQPAAVLFASILQMSDHDVTVVSQFDLAQAIEEGEYDVAVIETGAGEQMWLAAGKSIQANKPTVVAVKGIGQTEIKWMHRIGLPGTCVLNQPFLPDELLQKVINAIESMK